MLGLHSKIGSEIMYSVKKYYFSQFANLFHQSRISLASEDINDKLQQLIKLYDNYMHNSDMRVSPSGGCEYIIFTKHCSLTNDIQGYKFIWGNFSTNSDCEFFETYISECHRQQGNAKELVSAAVEWAINSGANKFSLALIKNDRGTNYLTSVYQSMEEKFKGKCTFVYK